MKNILDQFIHDLPLNTTDIPACILNIENRSRTNLFPWNGQFSPQLVEALLDVYSAAQDVVLDPFAGSGTVLHEAGRKGLHVIGAEINPAAYRMATTYQLMNISESERRHFIALIDKSLSRICLATSPRCDEGLVTRLVRLAGATSEPRARDLIETLIVRLDFNKRAPDEAKILDTWSKLRSLVSGLPYSHRPVIAWNRDARALPKEMPSVDLVITSPPYINVFNYHQQYRASAESLGWDLLNVARSEIGSNRKNRGNRFLTVIQYCLDLAQVLWRISSICRPSSKLIFIVGRESRVRGTPFLNGRIVNLLANIGPGLRTDFRQQRVFKNKFGQMIYEDILHFTRTSSVVMENVQSARMVAGQILSEAIDVAPKDALSDLKAAMARIDEVQPSLLYDPIAARSSEPDRPEPAEGESAVT